jgi:hypothetical protein
VQTENETKELRRTFFIRQAEERSEARNSLTRSPWSLERNEFLHFILVA